MKKKKKMVSFNQGKAPGRGRSLGDTKNQGAKRVKKGGGSSQSSDVRRAGV